MSDKIISGEIHYDVGNISEIYELYNSNINYLHPESEKYICRYCGVQGKNKFKSKAHLMPEFTGAKELFSFNECKECNNKFGIHYENSLKNFGVKNVFVPIKGKGGYKKHKDYTNDTVTQYRDEKTLVTTIGKKDYICEIIDRKIKLNAVSYPFIPLYVYKSLLKLALSLLKTEDVKYFADSFMWINDVEKQVVSKFPLTLIVNDEAKPPLLKPIALLLRKKSDYNSPEFTFLFSWGFYNFQIFLPLNSNDSNLDFSSLHLPIREDFVGISKEGKIKFQHFDMNSKLSSKIENHFLVPFQKD